MNIQINTTSELTIKDSLESIANDLILNKAIRINDFVFSLIDLEIYYWQEKHQDDFAKGVNHNKAIGELEAHRYGIDISLGNTYKDDFGQKNIMYDETIINHSAHVQHRG